VRSLAPGQRAALDRLLLGSGVFRRTYRDDPAAFVHDCFVWPDGQGPTAYQDEVLSELPVRRRVAVRGPHGLGKTSLAAWAILWYALTRDGEDWKCPTTASAWRQLEKYLWPEVHKWARRVRWARLGRGPLAEGQELLALSLRLGTGEAFAVASDTPALIEGAHADCLLYLFDEAKAISAATFDAAEGAFAGGTAAGEALALAASTPGEPVGRFYDINARRAGLEDWWVRAVSLEEAIAAGRISPDWAAQRERQWGRESAVFQNRVLGAFAANDEAGVIPLAWVEAANERWRGWRDAGGAKGAAPLTCVGVDVARGGEDKTVLALRYGPVIGELRRYAKQDTMATTGQVVAVLRQHPGADAVVDVIGIGAGVVDRLREQKLPVRAFNAGEGTVARDRSGELGFVNRRSAGWWGLREWLDPANSEQIALPPDDLLTGDLVAPRWRMTSGGRIAVEDKDGIKQRLGRSTDDGDAVMQAFEAAPRRGVFFG